LILDKRQQRQRALLAMILAGVVALGALIAESRGHVDRMAYGDGLIYRYVAAHLDTPPSQIDPVVSSRGTSLRYGRIGFPIMIWIASGGQPRAMPYAQAALIVIFAGIAGAATSKLFPAAGPIGALLPFVAPGFSMSVVGSYGEVPAVALGLWAVIMARRERWIPATLLLAIALLVREDAGVVLIGLVIWELYQRRVKATAVLCTSVIPLLAWYLVVKARYGHIPLFDPFLQVGTRTPVIAAIHAVQHGSWASVIAAGIHVVLMLYAFWMWRRSIYSAVAAAAGLQVLSSGVLAWQYVGDALRVFTFLQLFVLITLLFYRWPEPALEAG
jgi:hypothetical protein